MSDEERRIAALERRAREQDERAAMEDRLASGVERLSNEASGLSQVLSKIDKQQRQLEGLNRRVSSVANDKASKADMASLARAARDDRRNNLRKAYTAVAFTMLVALSGIIGGAWLTDNHVQHCLLHGPNTAAEQRLCDVTFPGHDHPQDLTLDALLQAGVKNQRAGCERTQERTRIQIWREQELAKVDGPDARPIHLEAARRFEATLIDCEAAFPLPKSSPN